MIARRASLWLIALALVAAQTLGFVHRVAHGAANHGDLFAAHEVQACALYDQLAGGALPTFVAALPVLPLVAARVLGQATGEPPACTPAFFDPRGPPALR